MKNRKLILKRIFACVMVVIMAVTAVPMSGFAGLELSFRANALSTDANGELVITAGETANVQIESNEITYLKFVPTASGVYTFTSLSSNDTCGYLYDSGKNQLTSDDDGGSGRNFLLAYELTKGTTYYWGMRFYDEENSGSFDVRLTCDRVFCDHENTKNVDAVAATCTTDGYTAGAYCEDCETWLSGHSVIPMHHTYIDSDAICDVCGNESRVVVNSGNCGADGSNVTFTVYQDGLLVFSGTGAMADFGLDEYNGCGMLPYSLNDVTSVIIGDDITHIGNYAFDLGTDIRSVRIPDSVTSIGIRAFHGCRRLAGMTLPGRLTSIGNEAFSECYGLSDLTIGKNVTSIGNYAFSGCTALSKINWNAESVSDFYEDHYYSNVFYNAGTAGSGIDVVFGDTVKNIPAYAFYASSDDYRSNIKSVTIGNNVTRIGYKAFAGCTGLTRINWNAESVSDFYEDYYSNVFYNAGTAGSGIDVVFGDTVKNIPAYAFYESSDDYGPNIKSVTIGNNVTSIGCRAFFDCTGLTSITIPEKVTTIGREAFSGCTGLTSLTIGKNVTSIDDYAFSSCTGLTSITIPEKVTTIGHEAFYGCTGLTRINWNAESVSDFYGDYSHSNVFYNAGTAGSGIDVVFGDTVKNIPAYAFCASSDDYRPNIKSVTIGNNVTSIGREAFSDCTGLTSITIPEKVTTIGSGAFSDCTGLTSITIPEKVTTIGRKAFSGCTGLTRINWNAESVSDFEYDSYVFDDAGKDTDGIDVIFGDSVTSIPAYAFCGGSHYDYDIGEYVDYTANIKTVTISDSVTDIGGSAFFGCSAITADYRFSDNLVSIGNNAFSETPWYDDQPYGDVYAGKVYYTYKGTMPENTSIVIKDGTKGIAGGALASLDNLSSITIPASVTKIGSDAFDGIYYRNYSFNVNISDLSAWCRIEFENEYSNPLWSNTSLYLNGQRVTDLEIPDDITEIKDYAFYNFDSLRSVKIPTSVTSIGDSGFENCDELTTLTIPGSVKTVGNKAFYECESLSNVSIENGVERIRERAFYETAVKNIILPDSVTAIGREAFKNCRSLASVTIGNGVETVPGSAFSSCSGLRTIKIGRNLKTVEANAFTGLSNIPEIFFAGSEAEWKNITIDKTNDMILRATMYYNADITHEHSYTAQVTTPATCTQSGVKTFTCDCGRIYTEVIAATGHNPSSWIIDKAATCTADGRKHKQCTACATVLDSETTPASEHSFTNEVTAATCTSVGYETKTCRNCGECYFVRVIPAKGHTPSGWKTDSVREIRYKDCTVCGELLEAEKITECVHRFVSEVTDPTCTANGFELKTCADCGETRFVRVIAAKGHALKTTVTPATQNESGLSVTSCKVCGMITKATLIKRIASVSLSRTAFTYNGKVQTPTVVVKDSAGKVLKYKTDYTISYASGRKNPGQYSVKVTFKGNYSGTKTLTFTIAPGTPTLKAVAGTRKVTLSWNKQNGATGYLLYMATSKNGKYTKIATLKGNTKVSYTKTGLTKGRYYYFKVIAYKTVGSTNLYGAYSSVRYVKVK